MRRCSLRECWLRRCLQKRYQAVACDSDSDDIDLEACPATVVGCASLGSADDAGSPDAPPRSGAFSARKLHRWPAGAPLSILSEAAVEGGDPLGLVTPIPAADLQLSSTQAKALARWCSMAELQSGKGTIAPFLGRALPSIICQGHVSDCSLMSALAVLADYEQQFGARVLSGIIETSHTEGTRVSAYTCCLFFNGTQRRVLVDDRVPVGREGQVLCAHSAHEGELWVTLLEKAIAWVSGGSFDMARSNPGRDLFHLTGWIPENIPLQENDQDNLHSGLFEVAQQGQNRGHCVVCLGTSNLADVKQDAAALERGYTEGVSPSTGLVAGHAYPVLNCRSVHGQQLLLLRNPWGRVRWKGRFSPSDTSWQTSNSDLAAELGYDLDGAKADDGTFWISWADVLQHFSHLYLCWAPRSLGLSQQQVHSRWELPIEIQQTHLPGSTALLGFNPQFSLRLEGCIEDEATEGEPDVALWVVLSRHSLETNATVPFMAASIYEGSQRCCGAEGLLVQGVFSNGECALVKLPRKRAQGHRDFVIVVSQHSTTTNFSFTLQVYTKLPGTLTQLPPLVPDHFYTGAVCGHWTPRTAGGSTNDIWSYFRNPQWRLTVPETGLSSLVLVVECPSNPTVNVRVFKGCVARPEALSSAMTSGEYKATCCLLRLENLEPGPYIVIASAFRRGLCADYRLLWYAPTPLQLFPQPHPFATALGHPLRCNVQILPPRGYMWLELKPSSASESLHISVRLQTPNSGDEQIPTLTLFRPGGERDPLPCERLHDRDATDYFGQTGALVILLAELPPAEVCFLEVLAAEQGQQLLGRDEAKLYINCSGPLAVRDVTQSRDFR